MTEKELEQALKEEFNIKLQQSLSAFDDAINKGCLLKIILIAEFYPNADKPNEFLVVHYDNFSHDNMLFTTSDRRAYSKVHFNTKTQKQFLRLVRRVLVIADEQINDILNPTFRPLLPENYNNK